MASATSKPAEPPARHDPALVERLHEAEVALLDRPRLTMRFRLVASLALCFVLSCAFSLAALTMWRQAKAKQQLLQTLERLDERLLRVRALGEEGALSASDLAKALASLAQADEILHAPGAALDDSDRAAAPALVAQLAACRRLLASAQRSGGDGPGSLSVREGVELRRVQAEANRLLETVIRRERVSLGATLRLAETAPLVLLGVQLLLFAGIIAAFARALVNPIHRFEEYTARIAAGDYSFIRPARGYRDEFSDLALAVNAMLGELQEQQRRLVSGAKLAAVGTLASGIAHELNNPLNNVAITTETLMEELPTLGDDEKWRLLQDIYFETERAGEIVSSLLDFTRQEKVETGPVDLASVVASTLRLVQNEMNLNNVSFTCELPPGLPRVRGVPNQLRQVLLNVLLNAIQAMPNGGRVWVTAGTPEAGRVCVEVRDEGDGIPADVLPRIFDPFFTTKEPGRGTGLGLAVSLAIMRSFGGDLLVTSEPGKGTTVHACLPSADGE